MGYPDEKINGLNVGVWLDKEANKRESDGWSEVSKISSEIARVLRSRISEDLCCDDDRFMGVKNYFENHSWEIFESQTSESILIAVENFLYLPLYKKEGYERLKEGVENIIRNAFLGEQTVIAHEIEIAAQDIEKLILERATMTREDCANCLGKSCPQRAEEK